jgi:hypothetical protein
VKRASSKLRLDVGCGDFPQGNVNCDLYLNESPEIGRGRRIQPRNCPNFVRCDTYHLPFQDNTFDEVFSSHLMEHMHSPLRALMEMLMVSNYKVVFVVPHRMRRGFGDVFYPRFCKEHHINIFNVKNISCWLRKAGLVFNISVRNRAFPHPVLPIIQVPWDIRVTLYKPY